eukprot:TRINITY_DN10346_c0_g1_i1.p2 TRINITY_DN10346_c0_g1~~TRINITY_DN10346_c0_g1_i1.p2  ORF type:complete len:141 (+),score=22.95 TRINITY_DN10346_c0_g1_i1:928-1350(+)
MACPEGRLYGFPALEGSEKRFKIGKFLHLGEKIDPDDIRKAPDSTDAATIHAASKYFPEGMSSAPVKLQTCMWTNTPDEHFVVGFHPHTEGRVVVGAGFSGHGFKFASVIGEILSELATTGRTGHNIELFDVHRPVLRAP